VYLNAQVIPHPPSLSV